MYKVCLHFRLTCTIRLDAPGVKSRDWLSCASVGTPAVAGGGVALVRPERPIGGVTLWSVTPREGAVSNAELVDDGSAGLGWDNASCTPNT